MNIECNSNSVFCPVDCGMFLLAALWNKIFRRKTIGTNRMVTHYTVLEDYQFVLKVLQNVSKIATLKMTGYRYVWWDNGNATSKYHACRLEVTQECNRLFENLLLKCGVSAEDARFIILREKYRETFLEVINLYKQGCPLGIWQKRKKIKELVFEDKDVKEAYKLCRWNRQHLYVKFMTIGYKIKSPLFIAVVYGILFRLKKLIRLI